MYVKYNASSDSTTTYIDDNTTTTPATAMGDMKNESMMIFPPRQRYSSSSSQNQTLPAVLLPEMMMQGRRCSCFHPVKAEAGSNQRDDFFYCPVEFDYCGVHSRQFASYKYPPSCENGVERVATLQQLWRACCMAIVFIIGFILSSPGRSMLKHILLGFMGCFGLVKPFYKWLAQWIMTKNPSHANSMILRQLRIEEDLARLERQREQEQQDGSRRRRCGKWRRRWDFTQGAAEAQAERSQLMRMRNHPDQIMLLLPEPGIIGFYEALDSVNRRGDEEEGPQPTSLALKTRVYHKEEGGHSAIHDNEMGMDASTTSNTHSNLSATSTHDDVNNNNEKDDADISNSDDLAEDSCTICYLPLEEGERVGSLPNCNHVFHVDCLKGWLTRRNVCPLCLSENIATPRYDKVTNRDQSHPSDNNANSNDTNESSSDNNNSNTTEDDTEGVLVEMVERSSNVNGHQDAEFAATTGNSAQRLGNGDYRV